MDTVIRKQALRFAAIGGVATGLQYGLLAVFVSVFLVHPVAASAIAFVLSALLNYQLNHAITFGGMARHSTALPRFFVVALVGLTLNTAIMAICYSIVGLHYLVSQVVATATVFLVTFNGNRLWSFR